MKCPVFEAQRDQALIALGRQQLESEQLDQRIQELKVKEARLLEELMKEDDDGSG